MITHLLRTFALQQFLLYLFFIGSIIPVKAQGTLKEKFKHPPEEAKPRGYWIWAHGNFDYSTIDSELSAFKEMGLGGVDIFDMGIADPLDIIPPGNTFMSEKMVDGISYALKAAKELDLKMGLSVSNGWNAGGDWTEPDEKLMRLLFWTDTIEGPARIRQIGFPEVPATFEKPYGKYQLFPEFDEKGFPEYYENVALVAYPISQDSLVSDLNDIIYFDADDIKGNSTKLNLPKGTWILTRAVVTPLGQKMWVRSDNSNGFIMDHYSQKATYKHFNYIIDKLESRIPNLGESALERLYLASFEAEDYVIWSPELQDEFLRQHGYKIDPYIPVFSGLTVIDPETTERFLHDYRTTVSEMFVNNHYRQASQICRDHGILLASESGGPGPPLHYVPTEDLKALGAVDIMRGEFWNRPPRWKDRNGNNLIQVVKNIGSAAHVYGHKIVEMEAFTSHNGHWEETPWLLKTLADRAFCEGMTRVVYHTMPHSPPEAGVPGWSYQAGTHIHPKMTWWPMSKPFHEYLARCSALLMEGRYVADAVYYKGGEVPNFSTTKYIRPDLGFGYDYDDLNTEILLQTDEVSNGKIVLPSGMEYEVLVLPDEKKMELAVLEKVEELIRKGATVIGPKPARIYGLSNYQEKEKQLKQIADQVWGTDEAMKIDRNYGAGKIINGISTREVLQSRGINPDITVSAKPDIAHIDYIHRTTWDHEIYFLRNVDSVSIEVDIEFRVQDMVPEVWDPEDGSMHPIAVYRKGAIGTIIPLAFAPKESCFVVFKKAEVSSQHIQNIELNGKDIYPVSRSKQEGVYISTETDQRLAIAASVPGTYKVTLSGDQVIPIELNNPVLEKVVEGPWEVRFPTGWGVEPIQRFWKLQDWTAFEDPDLKHFSGKAKYENEFMIEAGELDANSEWLLDLGKVGEVASVYLNGTLIEHCVFPPFRIDISDQIREGKNFLVVEVANTWRNRMVYDAHLPPEKQLTRSNVARSSDPSDRLWKDRPILPSGLIGPVKILRYQKAIIEL